MEVIVSTGEGEDAPAIDMLVGNMPKGEALAANSLVGEAVARGMLARGVLARGVLAGEALAREALANGVLARGVLARGVLARGVLAREALEVEVALEVLFAPSAGAGGGSTAPGASWLRYTVNRSSGPAARRAELVFLPPQYSVELPGQTVLQLVRPGRALVPASRASAQ